MLSPDALLDAIRQAARPTPPVPRVIGIDDWSWRRGHRFGTILVDLERHAVVDLLPDRAVESTVAWLKEHPEQTSPEPCGSCRHSMIACRSFCALAWANQWLRVPTIARPSPTVNNSCYRSG
jgi:hypothetical protein